jgi:hypothetical protein
LDFHDSEGHLHLQNAQGLKDGNRFRGRYRVGTKAGEDPTTLLFLSEFQFQFKTLPNLSGSGFYS